MRHSGVSDRFPAVMETNRASATVVLFAVFATACVTLEWRSLGPTRVEPVVGAEVIGSEECAVCHEAVQGHELMPPYHANCESCHGGGSLHADSEEEADIRFPASQDCLACHGVGFASHLEWVGGDHEGAGLLCSDCHNSHNRLENNLRPIRAKRFFQEADAATLLCVECHTDVEARFQMPSHHPVGEGALGCLSCHDPHGDSRTSWGAESEMCSSCHRDIRGPWTFEHTPVVEGCSLCHNPHGAVAQNLVETAQPGLCLSCHSLNDTYHHVEPSTGISGNTVITRDFSTIPGESITSAEAMTFLRRCTDCHGAIHGSYIDEHLRH
jgi:DmsE family decaheme c-type cytochrome